MADDRDTAERLLSNSANANLPAPGFRDGTTLRDGWDRGLTSAGEVIETVSRFLVAAERDSTPTFEQRKRESATKFYAGWIAQLQDEGAITPSVGGPRITRRDGRYYVDPAQRVWHDESIPEGLAPVSQAAAVTIAVEYDLAAHGIEA